MQCWNATGDKGPSASIKNGHCLSVINIIAQKRRATVAEIKEELDARFSDKDLNVYYYLGQLKKQGLIDVTIEGRQRYYSLR
jgi:DNA-binding PadR family transcriptional regulator